MPTAGTSSQPSPPEPKQKGRKEDVSVARRGGRAPGPGLVLLGLRPRPHTLFSLFPRLFFGAAVIGEQQPGRQHPDRRGSRRSPAAGELGHVGPRKRRFLSPETRSSSGAGSRSSVGVLVAANQCFTSKMLFKLPLKRCPLAGKRF